MSNNKYSEPDRIFMMARQSGKSEMSRAYIAEILERNGLRTEDMDVAAGSIVFMSDMHIVLEKVARLLDVEVRYSPDCGFLISQDDVKKLADARAILAEILR